ETCDPCPRTSKELGRERGDIIPFREDNWGPANDPPETPEEPQQRSQLLHVALARLGQEQLRRSRPLRNELPELTPLVIESKRVSDLDRDVVTVSGRALEDVVLAIPGITVEPLSLDPSCRTSKAVRPTGAVGPY